MDFGSPSSQRSDNSLCATYEIRRPSAVNITALVAPGVDGDPEALPMRGLNPPTVSIAVQVKLWPSTGASPEAK